MESKGQQESSDGGQEWEGGLTSEEEQLSS